MDHDKFEKVEAIQHGWRTYYFFVGLALGLVIGLLSGNAFVNGYWEKRAVEKGKAEWYVEGHKILWRWK